MAEPDQSTQRAAAPSQFFGKPHPQAWVDIQDAQKTREEEKRSQEVQDFLQQTEAKYRHLPPLLPPLPSPTYSDAELYPSGQDDALRSLYSASAEGRLKEVQDIVAQSQPSLASLEYALEEACQNFQVDVVQFLLEKTKVKLHYRCFRRSKDHPKDLADDDLNLPEQHNCQSIFSSIHPKLLDLLNTLHENAWHPNQLLGPLQRPRWGQFHHPLQEVALHYPRCLKDTDILEFLLKAGADPTIARAKARHNILPPSEIPTQRLTGHILETAVNTASPEAVDILLSFDAEPDRDWAPLHSLARRYNIDGTRLMLPEEELLKDAGLPESPYPDILTERLAMAEHILSKGVDINEQKSIFHIVGKHNEFGQAGYAATPLFHATAYMDWGLVKWLLENGAEAEDKPVPESRRHRRTYALNVDVEEHRRRFDEMLQTVTGDNKKDQ